MSNGGTFPVSGNVCRLYQGNLLISGGGFRAFVKSVKLELLARLVLGSLQKGFLKMRKLQASSKVKFRKGAGKHSEVHYLQARRVP